MTALKACGKAQLRVPGFIMCSLRSLSLTLAASRWQSSLFMAWSSILENPYRECKNETQASMAEGAREPEKCRISPKGVRSYTHTHFSYPLPLSKPRVDTGLVSCEAEQQHPENWCLRLVSKKLVTPSNWLPSLGLNLHIHKRWLWIKNLQDSSVLILWVCHPQIQMAITTS